MLKVLLNGSTMKHVESSTPNSQQLSSPGETSWISKPRSGVFRESSSPPLDTAAAPSPKPSYKQVCEGRTGHAEAVKVVYDSRSVSYASLCDVFWRSHDPTNNDFLEIGASTHRRSVVYYGTVEERRVAQQSKIRRQMKLDRRIVTKIKPLISSACGEDDGFFYVAENEYQKSYLQRQHWLCIRMGLRSTTHFVRSTLACKLNGILAMDERQVIESLSSFVKTQDLCNEVRAELQQIIQHLHEK